MIHGVTRARHHDHISRIDKGNRHITDAFFGTDQRHDFFSRIQFDVETALIPIGDRFAKLRHAGAIRITVIDGLAGAFHELFDNDRRRRNIRVADSQVDQIDSAR